MAKQQKQKVAPVCTGNEELLKASKTEAKVLLALYKNTEQGFNEEEVEKSQDEYGENIMTHAKKVSWLKRIYNAFINPFTVVLIILAIIQLITDVILAGAGEKDPAAPTIVIVMVLVSGILRFVQESKSDNAAQSLKAMIKTTATVQRVNENGKSVKMEIPFEEIAVGDVVHLSAGDMIPADMRILNCKDLFVRESSLTGESLPIEKTASVLTFSHKNSIQLNNLVFAGSNVISGSATAVVVTIGTDTHLGSVATRLSLKKPQTSFEKGVKSVSWLLIIFMLAMIPIVFLTIGIKQGVIGSQGNKAWMEALLFGLAIAVGLTPEMLPMIVTAGLAKGAVRMSKKKTVVKNLNSIQNFGAIDILCTDKTGTLTEDEIVLEKYLDIHGEPEERVLRHALLNSYYQTGVKNLMDEAIINHIKDKGMMDISTDYIKVDEVPFDFARRRLSVVVEAKSTGKRQMITKGAVEEMMSVCTHAEYEGKAVVLTEKIKDEILKMVDRLNNEGMRVLGIAQKTNPAPVGLFGVKDECDLVLIGYLAFLDPPKKSSKQAIKALHEYGVEVKVLTGDNLAVTKCIAGQVGLPSCKTLLGTDIESMSDELLKTEVEKTNIFAKLSPQQKVRVVAMLRENGHVVGFLGDGINDAAAIREADVGISVDTAVDIAKESADIILMEKDLMVLEQGIIEGRITFANIVKYIKMTAASNFGNMFAVLFAVFFVPFLPMLPIQILVLNLIYDISCVSIPWDRVDHDFIKKPRKWQAKSIRNFMFWMGPASSLFDITTYILMLFVVCPMALGAPVGTSYGSFAAVPADQVKFVMIFQAGWFIESLLTQTLVIHLLRTRSKNPFGKSRASWAVIGLTSAGIMIGVAIPFIPFISNEVLKMRMPSGDILGLFIGIMVATIAAYMALVTLFKHLYVKRYKELL